MYLTPSLTLLSKQYPHLKIFAQPFSSAVHFWLDSRTCETHLCKSLPQQDSIAFPNPKFPGEANSAGRTILPSLQSVHFVGEGDTY